jgi:hypothetical protein
MKPSYFRREVQLLKAASVVKDVDYTHIIELGERP